MVVLGIAPAFSPWDYASAYLVPENAHTRVKIGENRLLRGVFDNRIIQLRREGSVVLRHKEVPLSASKGKGCIDVPLLTDTHSAFGIQAAISNIYRIYPVNSVENA